jgi:hypothetical protein
MKRRLREFADLFLLLSLIGLAAMVLLTAFGCEPNHPERPDSCVTDGEEILYCEPLAVPEPPPIDDEGGG